MKNMVLKNVGEQNEEDIFITSTFFLNQNGQLRLLWKEMTLYISQAITSKQKKKQKSMQNI